MILQGGADNVVNGGGIEALYAQLAAGDKLLQVFADAGHWFYDVLSPAVPRAKFSEAKREQVVSVIKNWLKSH